MQPDTYISLKAGYLIKICLSLDRSQFSADYFPFKIPHFIPDYFCSTLSTASICYLDLGEKDWPGRSLVCCSGLLVTFCLGLTSHWELSV